MGCGGGIFGDWVAQGLDAACEGGVVAGEGGEAFEGGQFGSGVPLFGGGVGEAAEDFGSVGFVAGGEVEFAERAAEGAERFVEQGAFEVVAAAGWVEGRVEEAEGFVGTALAGEVASVFDGAHG